MSTYLSLIEIYNFCNLKHDLFFLSRTQGGGERAHLDSSGSDSESEAGTKASVLSGGGGGVGGGGGAHYAPASLSVGMPTQVPVNTYPTLAATNIIQPMYHAPEAARCGLLHDYQTL